MESLSELFKKAEECLERVQVVQEAIHLDEDLLSKHDMALVKLQESLQIQRETTTKSTSKLTESLEKMAIQIVAFKANDDNQSEVVGKHVSSTPQNIFKKCYMSSTIRSHLMCILCIKRDTWFFVILNIF